MSLPGYLKTSIAASYREAGQNALEVFQEGNSDENDYQTLNISNHSCQEKHNSELRVVLYLTKDRTFFATIYSVRENSQVERIQEVAQDRIFFQESGFLTYYPPVPLTELGSDKKDSIIKSFQSKSMKVQISSKNSEHDKYLVTLWSPGWFY